MALASVLHWVLVSDLVFFLDLDLVSVSVSVSVSI
jgi:hypothetical protein